MRKPLLLFLLLVALSGRAQERPRVVTLHPLLSEMVTKIAGDALRVETLMPPTADPHSFDPTPGDMAKVRGAARVVAMGKHLEPYLERLRENLPEGAGIYEAGKPVPSLVVRANTPAFVCCPEHTHGAVDPHWWQSPMAMRRAVRGLGRELENLLPAEASRLRDNTRALMDELEELDAWVRRELEALPRADRKLVTAHLAFGYFCEAYGFTAIPVQGLHTEDSPSPAHLAETIATLRRENVRAIFPEKNANNTVLESLREATGVSLAPPLLSDNLGESGVDYAGMIRQNVRTILRALGPAPSHTPSP